MRKNKPLSKKVFRILFEWLFCFRLALDAVHRMHLSELSNLNVKLKNCQEELTKLQQLCANQATQQLNASEEILPVSSDEIRSNRFYCVFFSYFLCLLVFSKSVVEKLSAELRNLSALYSQKCLENSHLDEKLQTLLVDKHNNAAVRLGFSRKWLFASIVYILWY